MGKCNNCGKKIQYNKYKRYRKQILCQACYDTRLDRKAEKKSRRTRKAKDVIPEFYGGEPNEKAIEEKTIEETDSSN